MNDIVNSENLLKKLARWANDRPDDIAFSVYKQKDIQYQELFDEAKKRAVFLNKIVSPGEFVVVALPSGDSCVFWFYACLMAGVCLVPIYPPKNNYDITRVQNVLQHLNPKLMIMNDISIQEHIENRDCQFVQDDQMTDVTAEEISKFDIYEWPSDGLCLLQYSSGSTQQPKAVEVLFGTLMSSLAMMSQAMQLTDKDIGCSWLPPYHDMGLIGGIFLPIYCGFLTYLISPKIFSARPLTWLEIISQKRCTITAAPHFAYELCAHRIASNPGVVLDLSHLRIAINGSEFIRPSTAQKFMDIFQRYGLQKNAFKPAYGLAESILMVTYASNGMTINKYDRQKLRSGVAELCLSTALEDESVELVSCGAPLENIEIVIVDHFDGKPRSSFHIGEIWIHSPTNAVSYYGNAEMTENTFNQTHQNQKGLMRTGDSGFLDDQGNLYITGRLKDSIKHRGEHVFAEEIEDTILKSLQNLNINPSFRCAAICVHQEGQEHLVILQESHPSHEKHALSKRISHTLRQSFGIDPEKIVFLKRGKIPRTTSGKIKRHASRILYEHGLYEVLGDILKKDF